MKQIQFKSKIAAVSLSAFLAFTVPAGLLLAAEESRWANDPVIENPGLLPTNPFYFLKHFRRLTQRAITISPVKKADLELDILNQKAAELKRLLEIAGEDVDALSSATDLYEESLNRLQSYFSGIKENTDNAVLAPLLNKLLNVSFQHSLLFADLEKEKEVATIERLENLANRLAELLTAVFSRLDNGNRWLDFWKKELQKEGDEFADLALAAETLNRWLGKTDLRSPLAGQIAEQEKNLVLEMQTILEKDLAFGLLADWMDQLPGNLLQHIRLIDEFRELNFNSEIKNQLAIARQRLIDAATAKKSIGKKDAENALQVANQLIKEAERRIAESSLRSNAINTLLARAKFNLTQAEQAFKASQYAEAWSQATAVLAAAQNSFSQTLLWDLKINQLVAGKRIQELKNEYDQLLAVARENELTDQLAPKLFNYLSASEKAIAKVSDLASEKTVNLDKLNLSLREAQLLILKARQELKNLLREVEKMAAEKKTDQPLIERVIPNEQKDKELKKQAVEELKRGN